VWTIGTSPRTCNQGKKLLLKLTMAVASSVETLLTMWILQIVVRVLQLLSNMDAVLDPQEPFNGDTTYHDDFRKSNIPEKYVHISRDSGTSGPFAGATTYQTDFKGQPIAQKCPVLTHGNPTFICDHMCY